MRYCRSLTSILAAGLILAFGASGCSKASKPDYGFWMQRANPGEQLAPQFVDSARDLFGAVEHERQQLKASETTFRNAQRVTWNLRDEVAKKIHTHRDRDLYYMLTDYEQKLSLVPMLSTSSEGAQYLPTLLAQVQSCESELQQLFGAKPTGNAPTLPAANEPCTQPLPRLK